jgi:hypothetical protein
LQFNIEFPAAKAELNVVAFRRITLLSAGLQ